MSRLLPVSALLLLCAAPGAQPPCSTFDVVPVPAPEAWIRAGFEDVVALPGGKAFAVGAATVPVPGGSESVTLAMQFDGQACSVSGATDAYLVESPGANGSSTWTASDMNYADKVAAGIEVDTKW